MDLENWLEIGLLVLFLVSLFFGAKWQQAKFLLRELAEALTATSNALDDNDITAPERSGLLREWSEVILAAKQLIGR